MIAGIGCDIVSIDRIKMQKETFYERVLTQKEQKIYEEFNAKRKLEFLAGRFAAKEAIYKAYNGLQVLSNIEILIDQNGKPYCELENAKIHISISHEGDYAIAYAIYEKI